ncbi:MAG: hypothetical protein KW793_04450 [Candidatus Doudnabacteria bacterium]|nr:hypothetical protein [Candidatus Doudnabacteria bacterium]
MKNYQRGFIPLVVILVVVIMITAGTYYISKTPETDQPIVISNDTPSPGNLIHTTNAESPATSAKQSSVTVIVKETSFGNRQETQSLPKTQTIIVREGQSFYSSIDLKPIVTKPVFKLEKINSATSAELSFSNEVAPLVNNEVIQNAPRMFVIEKGSEQCFATLWEDRGYTFCIRIQ